MKTTKPWYCYLLVAETGETYVGISVDLDNRLRQHNCQIAGGARATGAVCKKYGGPAWKRVLHVSGFPNTGEALRFEKAWKVMSKKIGKIEKSVPVLERSLVRRLRALHRLLALPRASEKGMLFAEYPTPLQTHFEVVTVEEMFMSEALIQ